MGGAGWGGGAGISHPQTGGRVGRRGGRWWYHPPERRPHAGRRTGGRGGGAAGGAGGALEVQRARGQSTRGVRPRPTLARHWRAAGMGQAESLRGRAQRSPRRPQAPPCSPAHHPASCAPACLLDGRRQVAHLPGIQLVHLDGLGGQHAQLCAWVGGRGAAVLGGREGAGARARNATCCAGWVGTTGVGRVLMGPSWPIQTQSTRWPQPTPGGVQPAVSPTTVGWCMTPGCQAVSPA